MQRTDGRRVLAVMAVVAGLSAPCGADELLSFRNDVLPVLGRAGCNTGSCHAKAGGQNGFELTVFSYDPRADYREIVRDARGRRIFPAAPEQSLLLRKATQSVDHEGGKRFDPDSDFYKLIHKWIAQGAPFESDHELDLARIEVTPAKGQYEPGAAQRLEVSAHYSDGSRRDITHLAEYQSSDRSMATVDHDGRMTAGRRSGEGVVIVRYMDQVDVARVTIPSEKKLPAEAYAGLAVHNEIDRLAYDRHRQLGLLVSEACSDAEFIRRASLDALGKLPEPDRARAFLESNEPDKRAKLIDELLADPEWADHWAVKLGDLLRPNTQRVGVKPVYLMDHWIRRKLREDTPWDEFVRELLTATGSTHEHGPVALFRDKREPADAGAFTSRIFLGVRLECAKCHHHPNERWGQDDYYQFAAFFGSMKRKGQGISAPISGEPEYWYFQPGGTVTHPVTGDVMKPRPLQGEILDIPAEQDPRSALVDWMLQPDNPFFARATVNRLWGEFFGTGIVHPVDDFRASNPPTNEPLLAWLAADFVEHGYDLKQAMRGILRSRIYQASSLPNETNAGDARNYARSLRRRLPAEVMADAVTQVTGVPESFEGLPEQARAMRTWNSKMRSTFLDTFGRPDASAECPCERDPSPTIVHSLHLLFSDKLEERIANKEGRAAELARSEWSAEQIVSELYLVALSRLPTADEMQVALGVFTGEDVNRQKATEDLMWALMNSAEFVLNH